MTKQNNPTDKADRLFTLPSGEQVVIDSANRIETRIVIGLEDVVDRDLEQFLDFIAESAVDNLLLMDFTYRVVGVTLEGSIILAVEGDVSEILNEMAENAEYEAEKSNG